MASEKADTWMPLYVTDYLGDTMHLTTEQHGAYMLLLMACWKGDGKLPNDDDTLAAITKLPPARWKKCRLSLLKFFDVADTFISHKRVMKERAKAKEISAERSNAGKKGAARRWQTDGKCHSKRMANDEQSAWQNDAPSPSPNSVPSGTGADAPPDPIWGTGLAFLKRKGVPEAQARSFLGKLRKQAGDVEISAALADAEAQDISDPIPWLSRAAVNARAGPSASKTMGAIQRLEGMKNGLAENRNPDRVPEAALPRLGSDPGD